VLDDGRFSFPARRVYLFQPSHVTRVVGFVHAKHSTALGSRPDYSHPTDTVHGPIVEYAFVFLNLAFELQIAKVTATCFFDDLVRDHFGGHFLGATASYFPSFLIGRMMPSFLPDSAN
jgi:hypothetical protein